MTTTTPATKPRITVLGGWRCRPDGFAYARGGCRVVKHRAPATGTMPERDIITVMIEGSEQARDVIVQHTSAEHGKADTPIESWPELYPKARFTIGEIFGNDSLAALDGNQHPQGLYYLPDTDTYMVAVKSRYRDAGTPDPHNYFAMKTGDGPWEKKHIDLPIQRGGGIDRWSEAFSGKYLGGARWAMVGGGLNPGQYGCAGVCIGSFRPTTGSGSQITFYAMTHEIGAPSTHEDMKARVMRSFPNYYTEGVAWAHAPETIDGKDVGYWGTNSLRGCPAIDQNDNVWSIEMAPRGRVYYDSQDECLSDVRYPILRRIDRAEIIDAIEGRKKPWEVRGEFSDITGFVPGIPRSISFVGDKMYIFATDAWKRPHSNKREPAVFVCDYDDGSTPADPPTDEPTPGDDDLAGQVARLQARVTINEHQIEALAVAVVANDAKVAEMRSHFNMNDEVLADHVNFFAAMRAALKD